jgi:hypothetical protein
MVRVYLHDGFYILSDLDLKDTLAIDVKWKIYSERQKEHKKQSPMTLIDEQERHEKDSCRYLKSLYNNELWLLHVRHNPRKTKAIAYEAIAMDDWRSNVDHNLNQVNIGQEGVATALSATIRDNMSISKEATHPGGSIAIPSAITAELTKCKIHRVSNPNLNLHSLWRTKKIRVRTLKFQTYRQNF